MTGRSYKQPKIYNGQATKDKYDLAVKPDGTLFYITGRDHDNNIITGRYSLTHDKFYMDEIITNKQITLHTTSIDNLIKALEGK